jgi:hypothetical protein
MDEMDQNSSLPVKPIQPGPSVLQRVLRRPSTRLGWWAVWLAVAFEIFMFINSAVFMRLPEEVPWRVTILPFYGIFMMLCGFTSGVAGLMAVIRQRERSWLVWLTILPGLFVVLFLIGEVVAPH